MSEVEIAFDVILNLSFEHVFPENKQTNFDSILLLKEYFRRTLLWLKYLYIESKWPWLDFGLAKHGARGLDKRYTDFLQNSGYPLWVKITLTRYLRWVEYKALPATKLPELPDPYVPLILMYQNHVYFTREFNIVDIYNAEKNSKIGGFTLIRKDFDTEEAFVELE